jgi:hypothetical protein
VSTDDCQRQTIAFQGDLVSVPCLWLVLMQGLYAVFKYKLFQSTVELRRGTLLEIALYIHRISLNGDSSVSTVIGFSPNYKGSSYYGDRGFL